ncbi:MAG: tetratricopeptide repeat protein [Candidatus Krumholzibacteriia bacterium]
MRRYLLAAGASPAPIVAFALILAALAALPGHAQEPGSDWRPPWPEGPTVADWMKWDARLARDYYNDLPYYEGLHSPRGQPNIYARALGHDSDLPPLTRERFLALPAGEQDRRRELASHALKRLRRFRSDVVRRVGHTRQNLTVVADPVRNQTDMPELLLALRTAAGLDPSNPHVWHQLAYFHAVVGDRARAGAALSEVFAVLEELPPAALGDLRRRAALDRAWLLYEDGWYDDCARWADLADTSGRDAEAVLLQGLAAAGRGDFSTAVRLADRVVTLEVRRYPRDILDLASGAGIRTDLQDPEQWPRKRSDFAARWIRAVAYLRQGEYDLAAREAGEPRPEDLYPFARYFWSDLGSIMEEVNRIDRAAGYYALAMVHRPYVQHFLQETVGAGISAVGNPGVGLPVYLGYGEHYLTGSRFSHATNLALLAMHELDPAYQGRFSRLALNELAACVRRGVQPLRAELLRGRLLYLRGDHGRAAGAFAAAVERLEARDALSPLVLVQAAVSELAADDAAAALRLLDRASALDPEFALAARVRAVALVRLGRQEEALRAIDRALALDDDAWAAWLNRGLMALHQGRLDAAAVDAGRAAALAPDRPQVVALDAAVALARARTAGGQAATGAPAILYHAEAEEIMLSPLNSVSRRRIVEYRDRQFSRPAADAFAWLGVPDAELEDLRRAYEHDPSGYHRQNLARALIRSGEPREGRDLLLATWSEASSPAAHALILEADRLLGDVERARRLARSLVRGRAVSDDPYLWAVAAMSLLEAGEEDLGRRSLERALELDPQNTNLRLFGQLRGY